MLWSGVTLLGARDVGYGVHRRRIALKFAPKGSGNARLIEGVGHKGLFLRVAISDVESPIAKRRSTSKISRTTHTRASHDLRGSDSQGDITVDSHGGIGSEGATLPSDIDGRRNLRIVDSTKYAPKGSSIGITRDVVDYTQLGGVNAR
jgi:hypothetical protein